MLTKRILISVLLAAILVSSYQPAVGRQTLQASLPTLELIAPPGLQPGTSIIDVQVKISGASNLGAFEFDLVYDHALVRVIGITLTEFLGTETACDPDVSRCAGALGPLNLGNDTGLGVYSYGTGSGGSGNGILAIIHLQPTGKSGTTTLELANALITDITASPSTPATQGTSLTLKGGATVYLPSVFNNAPGKSGDNPSIAFQSPVEADYPSISNSDCPDFDGSGEIDIADIQASAGHWRKKSGDQDWESQFDLDGNSKITIVDVMQVAAGWGGQCQRPIGVVISIDSWTVIDQPLWGTVYTWHSEYKPIQVTLVSAPEGMIFDPDTDILTWTPDADQIGDNIVTISVSDGVLFAEDKVNIQVSDVFAQSTDLIRATTGGVVEVTETESPLYGTRLEFPPGALSEDTQVTIAALSMPPPAVNTSVGLPFELLPSGLELLKPVELIVPYDPSLLPEGANSENLSLRFWSPGYSSFHTEFDEPVWILVDPVDVDTVAHTVQASLKHFTTGQMFSENQRKVFEADHFSIVYWPDDPIHAPIPSCFEDPKHKPACYPAQKNDPDHSDYVVDLAMFLETAYPYYKREGFYLQDSLEDKYEVEVRSLKKADGETTLFLNMRIHNGIRKFARLFPVDYLKYVAAHEVFHLVQAHVYRPSFNLIAYLFTNKWIDEASAVDMALKVFPWMDESSIKHYFPNFNAEFLIEFGVDEPPPSEKQSKAGYSTFPLFKYLRATYGFDLSNQLFTEPDPEALETGLKPVKYLYNRIAGLVGDGNTVEFWTKFGLAFHFLRTDKLIEDISKWAPSGKINIIEVDNKPSGYERIGNAMSVEVMDSFEHKKSVHLKPGYVATYWIDLSKVLCSPPDLPCNGINAIDPKTGSIVLELAGDRPGIHADIYRASPMENNNEHELIYRFGGATGQSTLFELPLEELYAGKDINEHEDLVVSFVNDPHEDTGSTETVGVEVYFQAQGRISTGGGSSCAVKNGDLYCWGVNAERQLGTDSGTCWWGNPGNQFPCSPVPLHVNTSGNKISMVSVGYNQACAISVENDAFCWGLNLWGAGGILDGRAGTLADRIIPSPTPVYGGIKFATISAGGEHTCGLDLNGKAYCWGDNESGQLGTITGFCWENSLGTLIEHPCSTTPVEVNTDITFKSISAGGAYTCGISTTNKAYCWGHNGIGQLGIELKTTCGDPQDPYQCSHTPISIGDYASISAGHAHTCAINTNNQASCWGYNGDGNLGRGTVDDGGSQQLPVLTDLLFKEIAPNEGYANFTCGITTLGPSNCWGNAYMGRLGNGIDDIYQVFTPPSQASQVSTASKYIEIDAGDGFSCAATAEGAIECWGENHLGQLGVITGEMCREDDLIACSTTPRRVSIP